MKKIASILLLSLLFFNWYGYRLITDLMAEKADQQLEARLDDNDYDPSQLIELRIPLNLPYHNDWSEFERYTGEVDMNGVHYKYVKRKIEKGELVLLCLPNNDKQLLQNARDQFFKLVNDLQQPNKNQKQTPGNTTAFKALFAEYQQEKNNWSIAAIKKAAPLYTDENTLFIQEHFTLSPEQPPELVA